VLNSSEILNDILIAPYNCYPIWFASVCACFSCILITPLSMLPCKTAIESLLNIPTMTTYQNILCTFTLIALVFCLSIPTTKISDASIIIGTISNSLIGYNLPIMYYLRYDEQTRGYMNWKRAGAIVLNVVLVCLCGI
jgi:hypothetical protein